MELVRLFNRFGMVSSLDVNNRIATCIVEKRIIEGSKPSIQFGLLTIVSIDSVELLQSNAVLSAVDAPVCLKYFKSTYICEYLPCWVNLVSVSKKLLIDKEVHDNSCISISLQIALYERIFIVFMPES